MTIKFDNTYARLPDAFYASVGPTPVAAPSAIKINFGLAEQLGIDVDYLKTDQALRVLSGNDVPQGASPIAMAYSGHQFGGFSPQLGDGRAVLLGEVLTTSGDRYDVQLKGSGPTPFSRRGDGRSALGPVLREYIMSEAMASMGVPTTRALAAVSTGEDVYRESQVPGGVFTRIAASHIRVGTFQWFAARQDTDNLKLLADYVISRHYPDLENSESPYLDLLSQVIRRHAELVAHWMQLGFIHGVMNTDNTSISGETIDYGPCAMMDDYEPMKTFSSIDQQGRYAFGNQATMAHWNLARLAETLLPLIDETPEKAIEVATETIHTFPDLHQAALRRRYLAKIGIDSPQEGDWNLVESLLSTMACGGADFTLVFRHLTSALATTSDQQKVVELFASADSITAWLDDWTKRMESTNREQAMNLMRTHNPIYIPRNHRIEETIQAAYEGDYGPFHRLLDVTQSPFEHREEYAEYESAPQPSEVVRATFCGT